MAPTNNQPPIAEAPGKKVASRGSILFVHGAGHGAWCWRDHFTSWFQERGYSVSAPDLPSHGEFDHRRVKRIPLGTYVDSVAAAAGQLEPPVILVGHSMGGFIIQKHLESARADLAILLASVPPTGALGMVKRMATRRPGAFLHTMLTGEAANSPERTRDYFFSPDTPARVVKEAHRRLQRESMQALRDMMTPLHPDRVKSPVVVMGAEHDWLVAPATDLIATAGAFKTTPITLPGGHDMMLDLAWEQVAHEIDRVIRKQAAGSPVQRASGSWSQDRAT